MSYRLIAGAVLAAIVLGLGFYIKRTVEANVTLKAEVSQLQESIKQAQANAVRANRVGEIYEINREAVIDRLRTANNRVRIMPSASATTCAASIGDGGAQAGLSGPDREGLEQSLTSLRAESNQIAADADLVAVQLKACQALLRPN